MVKNTLLETLVESHPELALKFLKIFAHKLVLAQQKIKELTFNDVFSRTASQLLKLAKDYGKKTEEGIVVNMRFSRQELAEMVGTTRETISRVISRFKKEKSVIEDSDIIILNESKLQKWI